MDIQAILREHLHGAVSELYDQSVSDEQLTINETPKDFEGHLTVVVFPFVRWAKKKPEQVAAEVGEYMKKHCDVVESFNVVKGFCNLAIRDSYWISLLKHVLETPDFGHEANTKTRVLVEYSSPNTNKPLHLGHIRNNLLGYATAEVLQAAGHEVIKTQIINDRGIHICKSMLAWKNFGNGDTPQSTNTKGDHFVGYYYVRFEQEFQKEYKDWQQSETADETFKNWLHSPEAIKYLSSEEKKNDQAPSLEKQRAHFYKSFKNTYFNQHSELGKGAKEMLKAWEDNDTEVRELWQRMNGWVYKGFEQTYDRLGVDFDKLYYESNTYLKGRKVVLDDFAKKDTIFYQKGDKSFWINLEDAKLDQKVVLRADGTSMYITQDIGTAMQRYEDLQMDSMVYVVADEQDYHFQVLFEILKRLKQPYADKLHHLSYGMVDLPQGRMKSREGTVVDADELMDEMVEAVRKESVEKQSTKATLEGLSAEEQREIWEQVALAALKFFILKVEPRRRMIFNPEESIDLQGHTGPYVQNAYVRTQSVQRMAKEIDLPANSAAYTELEEAEGQLLRLLQNYPQTVQSAAQNYNPADLANYGYELAKAYHKFWNSVKIIDEEQPAATLFRLELSKAVAQVLQASMGLLGIQMPSRM